MLKSASSVCLVWIKIHFVLEGYTVKVAKFIEDYFWLFLVASIVLGLLFPEYGKNLIFLNIPMLAFILFLAYLKIDASLITRYIRNPGFLSYVLLVYLIILPVIVYFFFTFINPQLALPLLVLASMPPGISSPALTDLVKGNTPLSAVLTFCGSIISPFTVYLLLRFLVGKSLHIDLASIFETLLFISVVPLVCAQFIRRAHRRSIQIIDRVKGYFGSITILCLFLFGYIIIANQAAAILRDPFKAIGDVVWLYVVFIFFHVVGWLVGFWRNREDKIALSVSKAYMNSGLAQSLAISFFSPQIALVMILADVPWNTMLGIFKYCLRYAGPKQKGS